MYLKHHIIPNTQNNKSAINSQQQQTVKKKNKMFKTIQIGVLISKKILPQL